MASLVCVCVCVNVCIQKEMSCSIGLCLPDVRVSFTTFKKLPSPPPSPLKRNKKMKWHMASAAQTKTSALSIYIENKLIRFIDNAFDSQVVLIQSACFLLCSRWCMCIYVYLYLCVCSKLMSSLPFPLRLNTQ